MEFKKRQSGVNAGMIAPHFHWLLWNVPRRFDFKPEPGKWAKISKGREGKWQETVKFHDGDKIATVVNAVSGQDRFTEWLSRNWYDVAEISFQPVVHELHVPGGFLAGTIATIAGFVRHF